MGTFRLTDAKGTAVVVRVYAYDSDVAARKGLTDLKFRPNHFDLHAMYRVGAGEWKHRQLLSTARVRFERVKERTPDGAVLELRSNVLVDLRDLDRARRAGRDVNPPFTRKLTLKDGLPVIVE